MVAWAIKAIVKAPFMAVYFAVVLVATLLAVFVVIPAVCLFMWAFDADALDVQAALRGY